LAIARDGASGGVVRTVTVSSLSLSLFLYIIEITARHCHS
jgi:hypothetical protein